MLEGELDWEIVDLGSYPVFAACQLSSLTLDKSFDPFGLWFHQL